MKDKIQHLIELKRELEAEEKEGQEQGKLGARERLNFLFDDGSFIELDALVQSNRDRETNRLGDGVVTGYGTVDGRLVYGYSQEGQVLGGSLGELHSQKIAKIQDMALEMGAPIVGFIDSKGGRIDEGIDSLAGYGKIFNKSVSLSGVVPQIASIVGPARGAASYGAVLNDFVFGVEDKTSMFLNGPQVIESITGDKVSEKDFGGVSFRADKSGDIDYISDTEAENIEDIREILSFLPSNNLDRLPNYDTEDSLNRIEEDLDEIIPVNHGETYDMKEIIRILADENYFFELKSGFGRSIITGFIRLNGKSIGVVANQPLYMEGYLDIDALEKGARFIRTCDAFNIPILNIVDVPGFLPSLSEEERGMVRHGGKILYAYSEATVPKVSLIVGKAYGGAYVAMGSKELGMDQVFAWPSSQISILAPESGASILYKDEIVGSEDPVSERTNMISRYRKEVASPYVAAEKGHVDDVIVPSTSRPRLISAFDMLETKRVQNPSKKHGNIPL